MKQQFRAYVVHEAEAGKMAARVEARSTEDLPEGELLVRVSHSSLNYKDALSTIGNRGVTRSYPHTPGIDAVGEVIEDAGGRHSPGDTVLLTGHDLGMNTAGGWGGYVRVPSTWALPLPEGLTKEESMALGTAGLTAGMAVSAVMEDATSVSDGEVLVTGATGGVGSLAISILARLKADCVAVTGKKEAADTLRTLGAKRVIGREEVADDSDRPLLRGQWQAAVEGVGGEMLANVLRTMAPRGVVAGYGNAGGHVLNTTVYPFILRGVRLVGIDSAGCPMAERSDIWKKLAGPWKPPALEDIYRVVDLEGVGEEAEKMLAGGGMGRVVVRHR